MAGGEKAAPPAFRQKTPGGDQAGVRGAFRKRNPVRDILGGGISEAPVCASRQAAGTFCERKPSGGRQAVCRHCRGAGVHRVWEADCKSFCRRAGGTRCPDNQRAGRGNRRGCPQRCPASWRQDVRRPWMRRQHLLSGSEFFTVRRNGGKGRRFFRIPSGNITVSRKLSA